MGKPGGREERALRGLHSNSECAWCRHKYVDCSNSLIVWIHFSLKLLPQMSIQFSGTYKYL